MSQNGVRSRGKTRKISAETWQRARDLVAAGRHSLREIARECGIIHSTLIRRKNNEGWYCPHEEAKELPPPPPKLKKRKNDKEKGVGQIDEISRFLSDAPDREKYEDLLTWCQELLAWSLAGVSKCARNSYTAQTFLIEKLPNVIKSLAIAGTKGGSLEDEAEARRREVEERMKAIERPKARAFDLGETPEKQSQKNHD